MKYFTQEKTKTILMILLIIMGIVLGLIANYKMRHYPGYLEVMKAARASVRFYFITAFVCLGGAYFLSFKFRK